MENSSIKSIQAPNEESRKCVSLAWIKKKLDTDDKPFKCKECPKKYAHSGTLHRHKAVHSSAKNFKCDVCGNKFKTDTSLRGHKIYHLEKTLECNSCPMVFKGMSHLKAHVNDIYIHIYIHIIKDTINQCQTCLKTFTQKGSLKRHELIHAAPKEECDICGWKFHDIGDLRKHKKKHVAGENLKKWIGLDCKSCALSFTNYTSLQQHNRIYHLDALLRESGRKCKSCNMTFGSDQRLSNHLKNHEVTARMKHACCSYKKKRPHRCEDCQLCFPANVDFLRHMKFSPAHRVTKEIVVHVCDWCQIKFDNSRNLEQHKLTHTGEKWHTCPYCDKSFSQGGTLLRHKRIHTGERPFQCGHCQKKFTEKNSLNFHQLVHSRERPHSCKVCEKSFSQGNSLRSHIRSAHTGEKPHKCSLCSKSFAQLAGLQEHTKMHTKQTLQHNRSICSKNFQNAGRLVYHEKTMHKKWTCKLCPKSFTQQWKRNDHERKTHIKEEPQKCKHCEYVSCRPGYLSRHIKRHGSDSEMQSMHYAAIPL